MGERCVGKGMPENAGQLPESTLLAVSGTRGKLVSQGVEPLVNTPEQFDALSRAGTASYANIINAANPRIGN